MLLFLSKHSFAFSVGERLKELVVKPIIILLVDVELKRLRVEDFERVFFDLTCGNLLRLLQVRRLGGAVARGSLHHWYTLH